MNGNVVAFAPPANSSQKINKMQPSVTVVNC